MRQNRGCVCETLIIMAESVRHERSTINFVLMVVLTLTVALQFNGDRKASEKTLIIGKFFSLQNKNAGAGMIAQQ
ncbi:MAG: hypothetical protein P8L85_14545 [Rubripirellula sp.]|nr:hypothetical protein [Rubripirellula sp.]